MHETVAGVAGVARPSLVPVLTGDPGVNLIKTGTSDGLTSPALAPLSVRARVHKRTLDGYAVFSPLRDC